MRSRSKVGLLVALLALSLLISSAVWAQPTQISNTLHANLIQTSSGTVAIENLSPASAKGLWDVFGVSVSGLSAGQTFQVKVEVTDSSVLSLERYDGQAYQPITFTNNAYTLTGLTADDNGNLTLSFRVTWNEAVDQTLTFSLLDGNGDPLVDDNGNAIKAEMVVTVNADPTGAVELSWVDDQGNSLPDPLNLYYAQVNDVRNVKAKADLGSLGMSHVDGVRYVVKVKKADGSPANNQDLKIEGREGDQWYELAYDDNEKVFYWGPPSGFTFGCPSGMTDCQAAAAPTTTEFRVTILQDGNYTAEIYGIQVGK